MKLTKKFMEFKPTADHSPFSPSSADRWMKCPASVKLSENIVQDESVYAAEGTLAHELCEAVYYKESFGVPIPPDLNLQVNQQIDGGAEMYSAAEDWNKLVEGLKTDPTLGEVKYCFLEKTIPIVGECYGTADLILIGTKGAIVADFKYGKGVEVKRGSTQLQMYLLGVYAGIEGDLPLGYVFKGVILQPRISPVPKEDEYNALDLSALKAKAEDAMQVALQGGSEPDTGNHCFWCPAKRTKDPAQKCPAIIAKDRKAAVEVFEDFAASYKESHVVEAPDPGDLEEMLARDKTLIKLLSIKGLITKMISDAESEFMLRLGEGEIIEGLEIVEAKGRRQWASKDVDDMERRIMEEWPDKFKDGASKTVKKLFTIGEVEKIVGKNKATVLTETPTRTTLRIRDEESQNAIEQLKNFEHITESV